MKPASVRDVAALAKVSLGTVSNVLNRPEQVSELTVARVQDAIAKLGFVRNDAARQLRAGQSRVIGLVVLDAGNPFFADLARAAGARAAESGYSVLLGNSDASPSQETAFVDLFREQRVHGLLISPLSEALPRLERVRDSGIPVVLVDREGSGRGFSSVAVDDIAGGAMAAEHLLALGRRRIAFVGGPRSLRQVADRLEGTRRVVSEQPTASLEVFETTSLSVIKGRAVGEEISKRAPKDRPDAIFAANDLLALGIMQALVLSGSVSIPEDIALIGYDDIDFAASAMVPLSSVRQPTVLLGSTAVDMLLRSSNELDSAPENVVFQPELVIRLSTTPAA